MPDYEKLRDQAVYKLPERLDDVRRPGRRPVLPRPARLRPAVRRDLTEVGNDTLKGYNVNSIALQVPTDVHHRVRAPADRRHLVDDPAQERAAVTTPRSRGSGMPLVNEVVIPLKDKDKFNASTPWDDGAVPEVRHQPGAAEAHRGDLQDHGPGRAAQRPRRRCSSTGVEGPQPAAARAPAELLRLNTSIKPSRAPKRLGVLDGDNAGLPERAAARRTT